RQHDAVLSHRLTLFVHGRGGKPRSEGDKLQHYVTSLRAGRAVVLVRSVGMVLGSTPQLLRLALTQRGRTALLWSDKYRPVGPGRPIPRGSDSGVRSQRPKTRRLLSL